MEDCHEGICEGKILVAALCAAIRVPVTEVMPIDAIREEHLCNLCGLLHHQSWMVEKEKCATAEHCSKEEQRDGNYSGIRTWVLPTSCDLASPGVFVQSLKRSGKKYQWLLLSAAFLPDWVRAQIQE